MTKSITSGGSKGESDSTYVVMLVPRCSDAEHFMEDIQLLIIQADSKSSVIKKLLDMENYHFVNFATSFIACHRDIGRPFDQETKTQEILDKLAKEYDELGLSVKDNDSEETLDYVRRNTEELIFLIEMYEKHNCDYIRISH